MFKVTEAEIEEEEEDGIHEKRLRGINCTGTRDGEIERETENDEEIPAKWRY